MNQTRLFALLSIVVFAAGCSPIAFVPGVRIGGNPVVPPSSWAAVEVPDEVLFRTHAGWVPRVVTIWAVKSDDQIYVSGGPTTGWVQRAESHPDVELRIGDDKYALRATRIDDESARRRIAEAYIAKYHDAIVAFNDGEEPTPELLGSDSLTFRLDRR